MPKNHSYVLGINAYDHDVSACLLRDGEIACAIEKERITRKKHAGGFFQEVVDYCLNAEGITLDDIDLVVRNCYVLPVEELETRLIYQGDISDREREQVTKSALFRPQSNKVMTVSHHLAHAYSAFAVCPFEEGAIMVVDGVGSYSSDIKEPGQLTDGVNPLARESESCYSFKGSNLKTLKKVWLQPCRGLLSDEFFNMDGLGALYSRVASYIFADWNKCGEVMGLAPYGRPDSFRPLLKLNGGELEVPEWDADFNQPWMPDGVKKWEASPSMRHWEDMAWRVQRDSEEVLLARARWLRETTGAKNLCLAGGVALNCVANGRIVRETGFDNVWIQPAAGDNGIAIGCAYYGHVAVQKKPRTFVMKSATLGIEYPDEVTLHVGNPLLVSRKTFNGPGESICRAAAKLLAEGNVFGWFQGRSEFGPRALGHRSILGDPRRPEMKDILNKRVKFRQAFRPFAPIVPFERANDIFIGEDESPFMLRAKHVRPEWKDRIPAIVHVDGTARVQTVRREHNERIYDLLMEFEKLTGVPVLVNTSFNIKGEPIVETPQDAMNCFVYTGIDYLALHDTLVAKTALYKILAPFIKVYYESMMRSRDEAD
ncbi:MAG TPA: carbamoyltransferase C-terminal domain-containing protein [Pseudolabrys sp.]|jgi:carbamoyltransferase